MPAQILNQLLNQVTLHALVNENASAKILILAMYVLKPPILHS